MKNFIEPEMPFFTSMSSGDNLPEKPFQAGVDEDGAPLYIARDLVW